jgi:co-chaperonin GroES (HSP10)
MQATLSSSGLVTSIQKKKSVKFAKLCYIGQPLLGQKELDISSGDTVVLAKNSNFINKIENVEYFTVRQSDIFGKKLSLESV